MSRLTTVNCTISSILSSFVLLACSAYPPSQLPSLPLDIPTTWSRGLTEHDLPGNAQRWWTQFNDPQLNALIDAVMHSNRDLALATLKVRKAQLEAGLTTSTLAPQLNAGTRATITQDLTQGNARQTSTGSQLTLSYEIDLWNKLAKTREAYQWAAEATEYDRASTALTLIGTAVGLYWQIAALNHHIERAQNTLAITQRLAHLASVQCRAGKISRLEQTQAAQAVAQQGAELATRKLAREKAQQALAILYDPAVQRIETAQARLPPTLPAAFSLGIPADILTRRPDVKAAERRVRQSLANKAAVTASAYPSLSISALLSSNGAADTPTTLADWVNAPLATFTAALALPVVQWNTTQLKYKISEVEYEQAVQNFRIVFYRALTDVEQALTAHTAYTEASQQRSVSHELAQYRSRLAEVRYRAGETSIKEWLEAQQVEHETAVVLEDTRYHQTSTLLLLYLALGGPTDIDLHILAEDNVKQSSKANES